jgi:ABC-type Zn uptake system ZnuABC Zn-binding protein ZnuA
MDHKRIVWLLSWLVIVAWSVPACAPAPPAVPPPAGGSPLNVLATETFLADIAQNVAGDRLKVASLLPAGIDPHSFEPAPQDVAKVAASQVLIVNGAGLESFLSKLLDNAGGQRQVIVASAGLASRAPGPGEVSDADHPGGDPHFWLDPIMVVKYVENIRAGLSQADPAGADSYARNAEAYSAQLKALDTWIAAQVQSIPAERRLLVTNHESLGYYADRYGFKVVGAVVPSFSSDASPSAQQLAQLVNAIKATSAPAVFLETGSNPQLAQQVAQETGIKVVADLYTHSLSPPGGPAPSYLEMMRYNTRAIVDALK